MPRMPKSEAEIIALAQQILNGLLNNSNLSGSPVDKSQMLSAIDAFVAKRDAIIAATAALGVQHDEKDDLLDDLLDKMQRVIDYTKVISHDNPTDLASIGMAKASAPVKSAPGQPRTLEIVSQTDGGLFLDWKSPADGGRVASYRVERRERPAGAWETCFATDKSEAVLSSQPKGKELEYRVVAFNSNGDSPTSNTVAAVL